MYWIPVSFAVTAGILVIAATGSLTSAAEPATAPQPPLVLSQTIALPGIAGGFNHHSADGKLRQVFLCCSGNKSVEVLDLEAGKVVKSLPGDRPVATCFAPDQKILCISRGKTVELYDTATYKKPDTLAMPAYIDELRNDPAARQILAGSMDAPNQGIVPIDLVEKKLLDMLKLPSKPQGFAIEDKGDRVFVCTPVSTQISIVDRKKPAVADGWKLSKIKGCFSVAFDPATHRIFVGCRNPAKLLVMDTDTGKSVASVDIGTDTDDLAFDPVNKRIYVACGEGIISVIQQDDADHYRNVVSIASAPGARNSAFIPETGEFIVTVPSQGGQEAKALVYKAQPAK